MFILHKNNQINVCTEAARMCERLQKEAVQHARRADHAWATIGELMGISRQAAQQRFGGEEPSLDATGVTRTLHASVANEMALLKTEGEAGYHVVDFGLYYLQVQASDAVWEHRREIALNIRTRRAALAAEGWTCVGAWLPFHYFKRQVAR
jgi:hypothetical protein